MGNMKDNRLAECLERGKIAKLDKASTLVGKELALSAGDLKSATASWSQENYKWTTIQSYYSMFHTARALLYK